MNSGNTGLTTEHHKKSIQNQTLPHKELLQLLIARHNDDTETKSVFTNFKEFICGWGAAFINVSITYPVNKLIFRQMMHNIGVNHAVNQLTSEGVYFLYRGLLPPLCQKSIALSLMFGIYEDCRRTFLAMQMPNVMAKTCAAIAAGMGEACIMPFERVQTLLQDQKYNQHFKNTIHTFRVIATEYGLPEFYRGFVPVLLRNCGASTVFFVTRDEVKSWLPTSTTWMGEMAELFLSGAVIGATSSTIFYPFNVIKVHMQSKLGGNFESTARFFVLMIHEHGVRSLYSGVHLNYTRAFISWGIINAAYEFLKSVI